VTEEQKPKVLIEDDGERRFEYPTTGEDFFDSGLPKGVFSPSQFGMYRRCPRQYEYRYLKDLILAPGVSLVKGSAIHRGAEMVHKHTIKHGKPMEIEAATQNVSDELDKKTKEIEDWEGIDPVKFKDNALGNFRVYYAQAVPVIRPVAAEKTFALKIGIVPVRGVIDLIDQIPGEYSIGDDPEQPPPMVELVSDLKTGSKLWSPQRIAHDPQLTFYSIVEKSEFVRIDFLLDQKSGSRYEPKRSLRGVNDRRLLIEDLEEVVYLIKQGVFPRCDCTSWVCTPDFCGYYQKCRGPK